jgi:SAM-dependent methyltransferase
MKIVSSSYDAIADEYYNDFHLTSRNLDQASHVFFSKFSLFHKKQKIVLELGAGRGKTQEYLNIKPDNIVQTDLSEKMLSFSSKENFLNKIQCDSLCLPFLNDSFSIITAFLYDPFNLKDLYIEIARVLKENGIFLGTLPHPKFALTVRKKLGINRNKTFLKRYTSSSEEYVRLNSYLMTELEIKKVMGENNLNLINIYEILLPKKVKNVSNHIITAANELKLTPYTIPILLVIVGVKE